MKQFKCRAPVGHISPLLSLDEPMLSTLPGVVVPGVEL